VLKKGRELVGFEVTLNNRPGSLSQLASIPKKLNLNIDYIETLSKSEDKYELFMIIDMTNTDISPEDFLKELRESKGYIIEASIAPSLKDIIYPSKFYVKTVGESRYIYIGEELMKPFATGIKHVLGREAGESFLYHYGIGVGRELFRSYAENRKIQGLEDSISLLKALFNAHAWANIKGYEYDDKSILLHLENLWECESQRDVDNMSGRGSHLVRGIISGFIKEALGKEIVVKETKCVANGDPYCEFEISIIT